MLMLPSGVKVFVSVERVTMHYSFDRLSQLAQDVIQQNPLSGHLFVFFNRRGDKVKILYWDRTGFAIWYKRLEKGTFRVPRIQDNSYCLSVSELSLLLEGIDLSSRRHPDIILS